MPIDHLSFRHLEVLRKRARADDRDKSVIFFNHELSSIPDCKLRTLSEGETLSCKACLLAKVRFAGMSPSWRGMMGSRS